jgi:YidC/Oxa1 family membrane protein insertase
MDQRRAVLAAVLCLLVLLVYQEGVRYLYPAPEVPEDLAASPMETPPTPAAATDEPKRPEIAAEVASDPPPIVAGPALDVETDVYSAKVSTVGGRILSYRLKRYRTAIGAESGPLEMVQVSPEAAAPLGVRLIRADGSIEDDTSVTYAVEGGPVMLTGPAQQTLTLVGRLKSGGEIRKALTFTGDAYPIAVAITSSDTPAKAARVGLAWRHQVAADGGPDAYYRGAVVLANKKVVHVAATELATQQRLTYPPPVEWAGYADHYFLSALVPHDPGTAQADLSPDQGGVQILVTESAKDDGSATFTVYLGPKDIDVLEAADFHLSRAVDFGWFALLAVPLLRLLKLFNTVTRNYGIDIILLTILVKVLFIPLSNKSMKSMKEMQKLQPQMAKLREKFKDDRERLNKEMIELYRRHRVNPLGGCLPMLLQFPVFIGLYQALNNSIELRHAPFALWIQDLSTYECYPWPGATTGGCNDLTIFGVAIPLLVVLMGASMILQQWISPSTGMDPTQQRMMMILMPIMFTVMFVTFPSASSSTGS